jgi:hypothetical protein
MIDARQFAALFAIFAGGVLNAGIGAQFTSLSSAEAASPIAAADGAASRDAGSGAELQQACAQALRAQLRADLGDPAAELQLSTLHFERASGRSIEGRGRAVALFDGGAPIPLEVSVVWDVPTGRVEQAAYLVAGNATGTSLDAATQKRIADRIGSRLVVEFAGQPVDFALSRVEHLAAGRGKLLVSGEGVADFGAEGAARTRFVATADRASGKLLTLQYELGEQLAQQ